MMFMPDLIYTHNVTSKWQRAVSTAYASIEHSYYLCTLDTGSQVVGTWISTAWLPGLQYFNWGKPEQAQRVCGRMHAHCV